MNNFTKEELVLLACWSANRYDQVGIEQTKNEGTIALSHKIQFMIDNYCEHTPSDAHYEQFRWQLCNKCGVQYK